MTNAAPSNPEPVPGRLRVPASYGIAKGSGPQMLLWEEVQNRLRHARNYWLATTRPDGRPHAMPVWGLWRSDGFYFGTDAASRKGRNLEANPACTVHLESGDDGVIVEGPMEAVQDSALLQAFVDAYWQKYQIRPDVKDAATRVYRLRPATAFAWKERDFPRSATR
ncbi:MAG: pyridoxamine 5'-phosphate oxidase [Dehalococcoidia bacterium]|nr:pyridoxamine 5'-phosphate oxidase [Dehalococcoidia bacterium]MSQ17682.1 pyridoxamine 5'-phosphate oxidase [Dehalococcoidia bacterium]